MMRLKPFFKVGLESYHWVKSEVLNPQDFEDEVKEVFWVGKHDADLDSGLEEAGGIV